jgi:ferredoxin
MLEILTSLTRRRSHETMEETFIRFQGVIQLQRLAEVIQDASLCALGQTAPNPVLSTMRWFRDEYEAHVYERYCPAGACTELLNYYIEPDACKGCGLCAKHCPSDAIMGAPKSPHYIVPDKCIGCGTCVETCKFDAIVISRQDIPAEGVANA